MRQSFAWWAFTLALGDLEPSAFLSSAKDLGIDGVEMLPDDLWPLAADAGLKQVTITGHEIEVGFNDPANHPALHEQCRMGDDAATSVTDRWGRVHGHDNLWVMDGSVHVTNGGFNPVLTLSALAFRAAEHLTRQ